VKFMREAGWRWLFVGREHMAAACHGLLRLLKADGWARPDYGRGPSAVGGASSPGNDPAALLLYHAWKANYRNTRENTV